MIATIFIPNEVPFSIDMDILINHVILLKITQVEVCDKIESLLLQKLDYLYIILGGQNEWILKIYDYGEILVGRFRFLYTIELENIDSVGHPFNREYLL